MADGGADDLDLGAMPELALLPILPPLFMTSGVFDVD